MSIASGHIEPGAGRFRMRTAAAPPPAPPDVEPTERLMTTRQKRDRRTRRTVDLSPATHRALDIWQREAADRLGLARVTGQEVLTALIAQLLADGKLSAEVMRRIQARR